MTRHSLDTPQFYLTAPSPCPYLKGKKERKVFTHLVGEKAIQVNNMLSQGGFRRSQNIAYRPACEGCKACVSTRVIVDEFVHTKSFKRILKNNQNITAYLCPAAPDYDQYDLFRQYLDTRHPEGGMSDMNYIDYAMMVEDSHVDTFMVEYRYRDPDALLSNKEDEPLVGIALTDVLQNGLSMVYSFFDTDPKFKSLGSYMILDHIKQARRRGLPYIYMGYWVEGSSKMDYKTRFKPQEHLGVSGWQRRK